MYYSQCSGRDDGLVDPWGIHGLSMGCQGGSKSLFGQSRELGVEAVEEGPRVSLLQRAAGTGSPWSITWWWSADSEGRELVSALA